MKNWPKFQKESISLDYAEYRSPKNHPDWKNLFNTYNAHTMTFRQIYKVFENGPDGAQRSPLWLKQMHKFSRWYDKNVDPFTGKISKKRIAKKYSSYK